MTLYEIAKVIRSKNAGPFTLTIDVMFGSEVEMNEVLEADEFSTRAIAALYDVSVDSVLLHVMASACAVKVTLPRKVASGSPGDRDVYGSQQHMALASVVLPERNT